MLRRFSLLNSGISFTAGGRKTSVEEWPVLNLCERVCWVLIVVDDCWLAILWSIGLEVSNPEI